MTPAELQLQSQLADWKPLIALLVGYQLVVVALAVFGRGKVSADPRDIARRIADSLERLTKIPGWAAAMVGTSTFGLLVAGIGFYSDVRWHVSLGRDDQLFTAPHSAIVVGLVTIFGSAFIGEFFATATKANVGLRIPKLGMRVPYSALAMGLIGLCALAGFPLDELWHRAYGIDVTMWSPTHLLMIVGASVSPLASWLALGEAGVRPERSRWATGVHIAVAIFALLGLSSVQGEFAFGVPQFQQLYHPVLYALAAGFALTAAAMVVRRWWAPLIVAGAGTLVGAGDVFLTQASQSQPRSASLYVLAGIVVSFIARVLGTEKRLRFAVGSGIGVGTVGLAGEWVWSQGGHQAWGSPLLVEAVVYATATAILAATLGVAFAAAVRREPIGLSTRTLAIAGLALIVVLALPLPRRGTEATAAIDVTKRGDEAMLTVKVTPASAATDARWFQTIAWQGGGFVSSEMVPTGEPGVWRTEEAVPVTGDWKTMIRLHKGAAMVAAPVWLPADEEIDAKEIAAVDRTAPFLTEERFLLREQNGVSGPSWFAIGIYVLLTVIATSWIAALIAAGRSITRSVRGPNALAPA